VSGGGGGVGRGGGALPVAAAGALRASRSLCQFVVSMKGQSRDAQRARAGPPLAPAAELAASAKRSAALCRRLLLPPLWRARPLCPRPSPLLVAPCQPSTPHHRPSPQSDDSSSDDASDDEKPAPKAKGKAANGAANGAAKVRLVVCGVVCFSSSLPAVRSYHHHPNCTVHSPSPLVTCRLLSHTPCCIHPPAHAPPSPAPHPTHTPNPPTPPQKKKAADSDDSSSSDDSDSDSDEEDAKPAAAKKADSSDDDSSSDDSSSEEEEEEEKEKEAPKRKADKPAEVRVRVCVRGGREGLVYWGGGRYLSTAFPLCDNSH